MEQFNWPLLVKETLKKRKEEGLTQKEHAVLAGVSIPTIISFDKAKTTISMAKVLDILKVVGMTHRNLNPEINKLDTFVQDASNRWFKLVEVLPKDSPARHPFGYLVCYFEVDGLLKDLSIKDFHELLKGVDSTRFSGWVPFWVPRENKEIMPYPVGNDIIECWLGDKRNSLIGITADSTDFWRASKTGLMYLQRGYKEDSTDILTPGEIFDLNFPITLAAEIVHYAYRFAKHLGVEQNFINLYLKYTGLHGRTLANWSDPLRPFFDTKRISKNDIVEMFTKFKPDDINDHKSVAKIVYHLLQNLYSVFGFYELQYEFVEEKIKNLKL